MVVLRKKDVTESPDGRNGEKPGMANESGKRHIDGSEDEPNQENEKVETDEGGKAAGPVLSGSVSTIIIHSEFHGASICLDSAESNNS